MKRSLLEGETSPSRCQAAGTPPNPWWQPPHPTSPGLQSATHQTHSRALCCSSFLCTQVLYLCIWRDANQKREPYKHTEMGLELIYAGFILRVHTSLHPLADQARTSRQHPQQDELRLDIVERKVCVRDGKGPRDGGVARLQVHEAQRQRGARRCDIQVDEVAF